MAARVDFYVLGGNDTRERLKFACRVAEKAYLANQRVLIWCDSAAEQASVDELLWTFADRSFVPHEIVQGEAQWDACPVWLACAAAPASGFEVLINLAERLPAAAAAAERIIEIVDADPQRRQSGRERFKAHRARGAEPHSHNIERAEGGTQAL